MRVTTIKWFIYAVFSSCLLIACAGTKLTDSWMDETLRVSNVSNVLVIGLTFEGNEEVRRSFENSFVRHLKAAGIEAISSMDTIPSPSDMKLKKEEILKTVDKFNNDAVIITHLIGKDVKDTYTPSGPIYSRSDYPHYYGWAFNNRGYSRSSETVRLATNLFDVKTENLIWSGQSKTMNPDSNRQLFDDVIKAVVKELQKNNLIPQK